MESPADLHPFDELMAQPPETIRLAEAALLFARDVYPQLKPIQYLRRLSALAERVAERAARDRAGPLDALRAVLVSEVGLRGNRHNYGDPGNSYLNRVLDTHRGIPISLSVIWLDVAATLGWPLTGVALPGHFIVAFDGPGDRTFLDPFNEGRELSRDDCRHLVRTALGGERELTGADLQPADVYSILERMLNNLYGVYSRRADWLRVAAVLQRLTAVRPRAGHPHVELAKALLFLHRLDDAATALARARELAITDEEHTLLTALDGDLRRLRIRAN